MKVITRTLISAAIVALISSLASRNALAITTGYCFSGGIGVTTVSTVTDNGTANLVSANASTCSNLCSLSGNRVAYIEFADKALYAQALSVSMMSPRPTILLVWEIGAPYKGSDGQGTVNCRVTTIAY